MTKTKKATIWSRDFICVMAGNMLLCLGHFSVNPHVSSYATDLGAGARLMGFLTGMFYGVALAMRPVAGPVITKTDKRKLLMCVFALGVISNLGYAFFPSIPVFIAFRVINGVQYGFVGSLLMTLAGDSLPVERMASGIGIYGVSGAIGTSVAPTISTFLLDLGTRIADKWYGYRLIFLCSAVIMGLATIPAFIMRPKPPAKAASGEGKHWYDNIFSKHTFPVASVFFFAITAYSLYNAYIIKFAEERGIAGISVFFTVLAMTLVVSRPLSGFLTDRFGVKRILLPGLAMFGASFIIVGFADTLPVTLIGAAIAALGYGASQPTMQAMCVQTVEPARRGVASNTLYIFMDLGLFLGPVFGGFALTVTNFANTLKLGAVFAAIAVALLLFVLPGYERRLAELRLPQDVEL